MGRDEPIPDDLREREESLEADSAEEGVRRYKDSMKRLNPSDRDSGKHLLLRAIPVMAQAIRAGQAAQLEILKVTTNVKLYVRLLLSIDPEKLALITLGTMLDLVAIRGVDDGQAPSWAQVVERIGGRCRLEWSFDVLRERCRLDWRADVLRQRRRRYPGLGSPNWSQDSAVHHLGLFLAEQAMTHATSGGIKLFERRELSEPGPEGQGRKTPAILCLTREAQTEIADLGAESEFLAPPVYLPMIVPPNPWAGLSGGGYRTIRDTGLVKRGGNRKIRAALEGVDLSIVHEAVNALQETPWRINPYVFEVLRQACEKNGPWMASDKGDLIVTDATTEVSQDDRLLKIKTAIRHQLTREVTGLCWLLNRRLEVGKRLVNERLYFPYQLDHRGRTYPMPQVFHPQSDDQGRALLDFADGKPLGQRGIYWLMVHIANCYGKDKEAFQDRVQWVEKNEQDIRSFAHYPPSDHPFWQVDSPWCLLAACKEWDEYRSHGPSFESHLPIMMDGTCNGLQHLSAMGRDPIGGEATNLVPCERKQDIYQRVADLVATRVQTDAAIGKPEAQDLVGRITRDTAKKATMNTPYGIQHGTIKYNLVKEKHVSSCRNEWECAEYLATLLEECIAQVVVKAKQIMDWLRRVAQVLASRNRGLRWCVPTGFVVVHEEREPKLHRIEEVLPTSSGQLRSRTVRIAADEATRGLKKHKQRNGVVANFVHSMDAAHMMLTVRALNQGGLHHFAAVHDGYGVHACDVDEMNRVLRAEFVRIYGEPVLERFLEEQRSANRGIHLDAPPSLGDLDLSTVLSSEYFFC